MARRRKGVLYVPKELEIEAFEYTGGDNTPTWFTDMGYTVHIEKQMNGKHLLMRDMVTDEGILHNLSQGVLRFGLGY